MDQDKDYIQNFRPIKRLVQSVALDKLYDELTCSPFYDLT